MHLKILIVDDEPAMLSLYSRIFSGQDYNIALANSFAAAAVLVKAGRYDLLITDLMLGDGLGTDLALLFAKESPGAKAILVTGSLLETEDRDLSMFSVCLGKPLRIVSFIEVVAETLSKSRMTDCCVFS
jgi:DNA-binding NtrC family response regulator